MSNNELLGKGEFKKIDKEFIKEGAESLINLSSVQEKFQKTDTDTFINELRDSMIGEILGFDEVNTSKHGFDCRNKNGIYLEVKNASFSAQSWQATFNDTTYEKALAFTSENLYLALAIWDKAADLLFIVYGRNPLIGEYLKERIDVFKKGTTVRSTQSISYTSLVNNYSFKIITKMRSKNEVLKLIREKNSSFGFSISEKDIYFPEEIDI
jgi:hypothetical protein